MIRAAIVLYTFLIMQIPVSAMAQRWQLAEHNLPVHRLGINSMDAELVDFDADGDFDVFIAAEFRDNLLLENDGKGRFSVSDKGAAFVGKRHDSEDIAIADYNNDGRPDIVFVAEDDQTNEYYLQAKNGAYVLADRPLPVTGTSNAVISADLNGDGLADLIIGNAGPENILINQGGWFVDESEARMPAHDDTTQDLELGDVDGDGDADLLVANEEDNRLYLNDGNGVFSEAGPAYLPLPEGRIEQTREGDFGDVDGDGDLDIVFANVAFGDRGAPPLDRLLLNDGTGKFTDSASPLPIAPGNTMDFDLADLDKDGDLDLIAASARDSAFSLGIYLNDGKGRFADITKRSLSAPFESFAIDVEVADFNDDNVPDIYITGRRGIDALYLGVHK